MQEYVLVTGGMGFIGSHTVVELIDAGYAPIIVDNLCNSNLSVLNRIEKITKKKPLFVNYDVRDTDNLRETINKYRPIGIIHFAALKAVGESVEKPLEYYDNNIGGLIALLTCMKTLSAPKLIFSSSATVYGLPDILPITENAPLKPATNPYGATKQMAETIITDVCHGTDLSALLLRYFNPIGAHPSGLLGELPNGTPSNLVPFVTQTAAGLRSELTVHGNDYDTSDGSGVRDYIHVVDLAKAHVKSLEYLLSSEATCQAVNIGTGKGVSVLEIISRFQDITGVTLSYRIGPRRPGDVGSCFSSAKKAQELLGWKADKTVKQALEDAWRWQKNIMNEAKE